MEENTIDLEAIFNSYVEAKGNNTEFFKDTTKLTTEEILDQQLHLVDYCMCRGQFAEYAAVKFKEYPYSTYNAGTVLTDLIIMLNKDVQAQGYASLRPMLQRQPLKIILSKIKSKNGREYVTVKNW